jgi:hypothetical protein
MSRFISNFGCAPINRICPIPGPQGPRGQRGPPGPPGPPPPITTQNIEILNCNDTYTIDGTSNITNIVNNLPSQDLWFTRAKAVGSEGYASGVGSACCSDKVYTISNTNQDNVDPSLLNYEIYNAINGSQLGFTGPLNSNYNDFLVIQYDTSGIAQWAARITPVDRAEDAQAFSPKNIVCNDNDVYVSVRSPADDNKQFEIYNSPNGSGSPVLTSAPNVKADFYVSKFNSSGIAQWIIRISGNEDENRNDRINDIDCDISGVCVTGSSSSQIIEYYNGPTGSILGFTGPACEIDTPSDRNIGYLVNYDNSGVALWSGRIVAFKTTPREEAIVSRSVSKYQNNIYNLSQVTANPNGPTMEGIVSVYGGPNGSTLGLTGPVDPSLNDVLLVKYGSSGDVQWLARITGNTGLAAPNEQNTYLSVSESGVYVTINKTFQSVLQSINVYNQPDGSTIGLSATGLTDGSRNDFIVKYDFSGNAQWINIITTSTNTLDVIIFIADLCSDKEGVYVLLNLERISPLQPFDPVTISIYKSSLGPGTGLSISGLTEIPNKVNIITLVIKISPDGIPLWINRLEGITSANGISSCIGCNSGVYVSGDYEQLSIFTGITGSQLGLTASPTGLVNSYFLRLNNNGETEGTPIVDVELVASSSNPFQKFITYETTTGSGINIIPNGTSIAGGVSSLQSDTDGSTLNLLYTGSAPKWFVIDNNGFDLN